MEVVTEQIEVNAVGTPVSTHPLEHDDKVDERELQDGQQSLSLTDETEKQNIQDGPTINKDDIQTRVLTPPTSDDAGKREELESSDLSDVEMNNAPAPADEDDDADIGDVEPAEYWDGGRIPIFRPVSWRMYPEAGDKRISRVEACLDPQLDLWTNLSVGRL
jgi:hypothetical protein